jgi:16S rRNA (cytosine1402-N4)-methyltransferase
MEEGPLDMRMDTAQGETALEWISDQTDTSLADALYAYGEERASRPIARAILRSLAAGTLVTTLDLAAAVYTVLPREIARRKKQIDPATRTFQAIRIAVNGELVRLTQVIEHAVQALKPGGRMGIISFHSLEDRIAKQTFRRLAGIYDGPGRTSPTVLARRVKLIHSGGLKASDAETASNPPSRSARLRIAERLADGSFADESHER